MRVVLDTNILVSAPITKGTPPDLLYRAWLRDELELVTSVAQVEGIRNVLARARMRRYVDAPDAAELVAAIYQRATVLGDVPVTRRSPDPKDDPILAVAVAGDVELVVLATRTTCWRWPTLRASQSAPRERRWEWESA